MEHEEKEFCILDFWHRGRHSVWDWHVHVLAARVGRLYPGVVIGAAGIVVLLVLLMVRRKMEGKPAVHISGKAVGAVLLSIAGALVLGVGMCMAMIWNMLVPGIVMGAAGILLLLCLIPLVKGLK